MSINEAARQNSVPAPPAASCGDTCNLTLTNAPVDLSCNVVSVCTSPDNTRATCYRPQYVLGNDSTTIAVAQLSTRLLLFKTCNNQAEVDTSCGTSSSSSGSGTYYCSCSSGAGPSKAAPCSTQSAPKSSTTPTSTASPTSVTSQASPPASEYALFGWVASTTMAALLSIGVIFL
jgi:hypothetical protein